MKAKITKPGGYNCCPNGYRTETFPVGTIVSGQVAEWALADHAASAMFDQAVDKKVVDQLELKLPATKKRGKK